MGKKPGGSRNALLATVLSGLIAVSMFGAFPTQALGEGRATEDATDIEQVFLLAISTASDNTTFILPTSSYLRGTFGGKPYNWAIDWGDGVTETRSGTSSNNGGIPHTYFSTGDYTITIKPKGLLEAWLGAFGFYVTSGSGANSLSNKALLVGVPSLITPQMTRTTAQIEGRESPPNSEWSCTFYDCYSLTEAPVFTGWEIVTSVGDEFADEMFSRCSRLRSLPDGFTLPQNLTVAGDYFAMGMFYLATNLTDLPEGFNFPQGLKEVGSYFAYSMFYSCYRLSVLPAGFNLPQGVTTVGGSFAGNLFLEAGGTTFQINDEFCFPAGIPSDSFNAFYSTFRLATSAPTQNRTAVSIIGECATPNTRRLTFDSHFSDIDMVPMNWGGDLILLLPGTGDLNGDGVVTMDEVVTTAQVAIGLVSLNPEQLAIIDMDGDGFITMFDVMKVYERAII